MIIEISYAQYTLNKNFYCLKELCEEEAKNNVVIKHYSSLHVCCVSLAMKHAGVTLYHLESFFIHK